MQKDCIEYQCKSGQTLFTYSEETGERKWPLGLPEGIEYRITCSHPVEHKQVFTTATQTDGHSCNNGCMSMHINTYLPYSSNTSIGIVPQQQPGTSTEESTFMCICEVQTIKLEPADEQEDRRHFQMVTANQSNLVENSCNDKDYNHDNDHSEDFLHHKDNQVDNQNTCNISEILRDVEERKSPAKSGSIGDRPVVVYSCNNEDIVGDYSNSTVQRNAYDDNIHASGDHHTDVSNRTIDIIDIASDVDEIVNGDTVICNDSGDEDSLNDTPRVVFKQNEDINVIAGAGDENDSQTGNTCGHSGIGIEYVEDLHANLPGRTQFHKKKKTQNECFVCKKVFRSSSLLQIHSVVHIAKKSRECGTCKKEFSSKGALNTHLRIHTGEKPFECSYCRKSFYNRYKLMQHTRIHTKEKPYECSVCEKNFSRRDTLNNHVKTHTGEKPFQCTFCKKFIQKSHFKEHLRIHTEEKPFECTVCLKKFKLKHNLRQHLKIHSGEKPFQCTFCQKKFARRCHLKEHVKIHTGEKPFECTVCNKKFTAKGKLKQHARTHTGEKPYECTVCNKKFTHRHTLKKHAILHNRDKLSNS